MLSHLNTQCKKYILSCLHQLKRWMKCWPSYLPVHVSQLKMIFVGYHCLYIGIKWQKPLNYRHSATNKIPEATSVHDMELEHDTEECMCPFTVHTLTSEEYDTTSSETLKAMAAKHLDDG